MVQENIHIYCYAFNEKGQAVPLFSPDEKLTKKERDYFRRWREIVHQIEFPAFCRLNETAILDWLLTEQPYQKGIILLFSLMRHLADPEVYRQLAESDIRQISNRNLANEAELAPVSNFNFQPVITIGERDIMSLFERAHENDHNFKDFPAPDPRFKFFDSSIWHRYEYLLADRKRGEEDHIRAVDPSTFFDRIYKRIKEIQTYHRENLYVTNAARSSLELQLRLLRESFIERFGNRGHYKAVTPFKFHAESSMKTKADKLIQDFYKGFLWKIHEKVRINWRFLMVDDYANSPISTFLPDRELKCDWTKRDLILHLLEELKDGIEIDYPLAKDSNELGKEANTDNSEKEENLSTKSAKANIIRTSLGYLEKKNYDIILLDYLLGRVGDTEYREFGHQFLQRLNNDAQTEGKYNRGPYGRYWIFPISSFPFAMQDKLKQLDIGHFNLWWYLVEGCDPISTPQMFRYSLLSFLQHQISEVLLSPTELSHLVGKYTYTFDEKLWTSILSAEINEVLLKIELLKANQNESPFAKSMIRKLSGKSAQYSNRLKNIKSLADGFQAGVHFDENEQNFNKIYQPWTQLQKRGGQNGYQQVIDRIDQEFERLHVFPKIRHIKDMINYNVKQKQSKLNLSGRSLVILPEFIIQAKHITSLDLSNNKLESLPDCLVKLTNLRELKLSNNRFYNLPPVLLKLQEQLQILQLENNHLNLSIHSAGNAEQVKEMLNSEETTVLKQSITAVKEKIEDGDQLIEAIDMIRNSLILFLSDQQQSDLIHCYARVRKAASDYRKGLINYETQQREESKVREALLVLTNDLKKPS